MRQVPQAKQQTRYLILGRGKVASHFAYYFSLLGLLAEQWKDARNLNALNLSSELNQNLSQFSHVLVLVSDGAIETVLQKLPAVPGQIRLHFSGALQVQGAISAHPLMTFGKELFTLEQYQAIPFIFRKEELEAGSFTEPKAWSPSELLPGLGAHPTHFISSSQAALYHALCVVAGNFPMILWNEVFSTAQEKLDLPQEVFSPYLKQVLSSTLSSALSDAQKNLTGPLVRGDQKTIQKNLTALEETPLKDLYLSFYRLFQESRKLTQNPTMKETSL